MLTIRRQSTATVTHSESRHSIADLVDSLSGTPDAVVSVSARLAC